ncbi:hypothetical protein NQD34_012286 [Periophthalmus magnuspinnatus]|uniref:EF-hand domain-containing protein n=1 Tax=Periophthalmus magnuspinnatus TaxID=409849 RepID=A0A3B4BFZ9_9GOBI|nr:S100 calcium binding protein W [Periophthalmus magnuspinnatus]KAJ0000444.1 hypothetical protein NQD34_012286 [Periophthalmus magnuspinnatus]
MSRLEQIITSMVDIFLEYADDEGRKKQLNKDELKAVLEKEIQSEEFKQKISAEAVEEAMKMIDKNHDGEINFREFCRCVCELAKWYFQQKTGKGGKQGRGREGHEED